MKILALLLLVSILLVSCGNVEKPAMGAGKDTGYVESTSPADTVPAGADTSAPDDGDEEIGYASYSGTEAGGDLTYTTYKGKKLTDFSFLDGLSKNFFSDTADKENGSWFCGNTVRNEATGEVQVIFDRADDVFDALEKYGSVYRKNEDKKVIYITFDCGYETEWTDDVLDVLKEKDVKASFFLNGQYIKTAPDLVKRMLDEGHIVGNHGNNHKVMSKLSIEELFYEVESNNELLQQYVPGAPYMKYFRPSYGSCSAWDMALYQAMDLENILYSWAYYDYDPEDQMDPAKALETMKKGLHNGSVLMLHTVGSLYVK